MGAFVFPCAQGWGDEITHIKGSCCNCVRFNLRLCKLFEFDGVEHGKQHADWTSSCYNRGSPKTGETIFKWEQPIGFGSIFHLQPFLLGVSRMRFKILDLWSNIITGSIRAFVANLSDMEVLSLSRNLLMVYSINCDSGSKL
jgi:hypothetical protein